MLFESEDIFCTELLLRISLSPADIGHRLGQLSFFHLLRSCVPSVFEEALLVDCSVVAVRGRGSWCCSSFYSLSIWDKIDSLPMHVYHLNIHPSVEQKAKYDRVPNGS